MPNKSPHTVPYRISNLDLPFRVSYFICQSTWPRWKVAHSRKLSFKVFQGAPVFILFPWTPTDKAASSIFSYCLQTCWAGRSTHGHKWSSCNLMKKLKPGRSNPTVLANKALLERVMFFSGNGPQQSSGLVVGTVTHSLTFPKKARGVSKAMK